MPGLSQVVCDLALYISYKELLTSRAKSNMGRWKKKRLHHSCCEKAALGRIQGRERSLWRRAGNTFSPSLNGHLGQLVLQDPLSALCFETSPWAGCSSAGIFISLMTHTSVGLLPTLFQSKKDRRRQKREKVHQKTMPLSRNGTLGSLHYISNDTQ